MKNHFLFFLLLASTVGCGGRPDDFPKLAPTTITVTQDGKPVDRVQVLLYSSSLKNYISSGNTDSRGVAVIRTSTEKKSYPGSPIGEIRVGLYRSPLEPGENPKEAVKDMTPDERRKYMATWNAEVSKRKLFAPPSLHNPVHSPVVFTIREGEQNVWNIEVNDPMWETQ